MPIIPVNSNHSAASALGRMAREWIPRAPTCKSPPQAARAKVTAVMHHDTLAPAPRHQSVDVTLVAAASVAMATVAAAGPGAIYAHGPT